MSSPALSTRTAQCLLLFTSIGLLAGCLEQSASKEAEAPSMPPPPGVSVAEVLVQDVTPWYEFTGRIEAKEFVQIRPRVGGVIEKVAYREGDFVNKGDLLFVIDQQPFLAELERAEAELVRAEAQAELARVESLRAENLLKQKLISPNEYDQRIAAANQANANVRFAQASVRLARLEMEYTEIRSPISGRTGRALFTEGNLVASDPAPNLLTTVVSLDPIAVYFDVDELTYLQYTQSLPGNGKRPSQTAFIGLASERDFPRQAKVDFFDNQVNPATGTIELRALLDNTNHRLTPGLFTRVKLLEPKPKQATLIDDKAILTDQDRKYVYVLGEENRAMRRDITIGRRLDKLRMINTGLQAGDKIIVHGIQKVFFPGMPVNPQVINMGDPPPATPLAQNAH